MRRGEERGASSWPPQGEEGEGVGVPSEPSGRRRASQISKYPN